MNWTNILMKLKINKLKDITLSMLKEHSNDSETDMMAPALSNSPQ